MSGKTESDIRGSRMVPNPNRFYDDDPITIKEEITDNPIDIENDDNKVEPNRKRGRDPFYPGSNHLKRVRENTYGGFAISLRDALDLEINNFEDTRMGLLDKCINDIVENILDSMYESAADGHYKKTFDMKELYDKFLHDQLDKTHTKSDNEARYVVCNVTQILTKYNLNVAYVDREACNKCSSKVCNHQGKTLFVVTWVPESKLIHETDKPY